MYYESTPDVRGGILLDSSIVTMSCFYPKDGNSMGRHCDGGYGDGVECIPGCYPKGEECNDVGRMWMCSYAPSALKEALQFQESLGVYPDLIIRGQGENNNEVVLDTRSITENLPHVVLAFFYRPEDTHEAGEAVVREHRRNFLRAFGLSNEHAPLVRYDPHVESGVFSLM